MHRIIKINKLTLLHSHSGNTLSSIVALQKKHLGLMTCRALSDEGVHVEVKHADITGTFRTMYDEAAKLVISLITVAVTREKRVRFK
jgi:hypothetical protein